MNYSTISFLLLFSYSWCESIEYSGLTPGTCLHRTLPKTAHSHCLPYIKAKCCVGGGGSVCQTSLTFPKLPTGSLQQNCFLGRSLSPHATIMHEPQGLDILCRGSANVIFFTSKFIKKKNVISCVPASLKCLQSWFILKNQ